MWPPPGQTLARHALPQHPLAAERLSTAVLGSPGDPEQAGKGQVPRCSPRSLTTGHAPSDQFEITVDVIADEGWCRLANETPAS